MAFVSELPVVRAIDDLRAAIAAARRAGRRIAFVPTMGALHEGHLRLLDRAAAEADFVVLSIFVNPLQFAPHEDLARYPRDFARDQALAATRGTHLLFAPRVETMYPTGAETRVVPGPTADHWEGAVRPGHFSGVLTVVLKLFQLVQPDVAIFGQKDAQQVALVQRMVRDFDVPVRIVVAPTVREADGLALSSRNAFLSAAERGQALVLSRALQAAQARFAAGERRAAPLHEIMAAVFATEPSVHVDYLSVVDPLSFAPVDAVSGDTLIAVAARVGQTRLLDNLVLGPGVS
jgi:pantoate--beta-alanine ligase